MNALSLITKSLATIVFAALTANPLCLAADRNVWAVTVGVDDYGPHISGLNYAVSDCGHFTDFLGTLGDDSDVHITQLTTDETDAKLKPTKANVLTAVRSVAAKAGPNDEFWFYFSGHGISSGGVSYLATPDIDVRDIPDSIVSIHDLRAILQTGCKAAIRVIVADACESGSPRRIIETTAADNQNAPNILTVAACKPNQCAWETGSIWGGQGGGVFTYYLIRGLAGDAADQAASSVTVGAIEPYLTRSVPDAVEKLTEAEQDPVIIRGAAVPSDASVADRNDSLLQTVSGRVANPDSHQPLKAIVIVKAFESRTAMDGSHSAASHVLRAELDQALLDDGMVVFDGAAPPARSGAAGMKVYTLTCHSESTATVLPDSEGFVTSTTTVTAELTDSTGETIASPSITTPQAGATEQSAYTRGIHATVEKLIEKLEPKLDRP